MNDNQDAAMPEALPTSEPTGSGQYYAQRFANRVFSCFSITAWIKAMTGLTDAQIHHFDSFIAANEWNFDGSALTDYELAINTPGTTSASLHEPFQRLCNNFFERLDAAKLPGDLVRAPSQSGVRVWQAKKVITFISKRDWKTLPHRSEKCVPYGNVVFPMDMRLNRPWDEKAVATGHRGPYTRHKEEEGALKEKIRSARPDVPQWSFKKRMFMGKRRMEWDFDLGCFRRPMKRIRMDAQTAWSIAQYIPPRPKSMFADVPAIHARPERETAAYDYDDENDLLPSAIRNRESRLVRRIRSMSLKTYRFFTFGLFVENYEVTLWYFDCTGAMHSAGFHLLRHKRELMLLLFALNRMTPTQAGFNEFQHPGGMDVGVPATRLEGSEFTFTRYDKKTDRTDYFNYKTLGSAPLFDSEEMEGRRTHVVALEGNLVVKFAWMMRDKYMMPETHYIDKILEHSPKLKAHLPDVHYFGVFNASRRLPRWQFLMTKEDIRRMQVRDLSVMVTQRYQALWEVESVKEFTDVFMDVFECHHEAYVKAGVLHRDISTNNLMFQRYDDGVNGVLMDFDIALDLSIPGAPNNLHTGTTPFMAIERLESPPPPHIYRHDLESFFYVILLAGIMFDMKAKNHRKTPDALGPWMGWAQDGPDSGSISREAKLRFWGDRDVCTETVYMISDEFRPLEGWITPLRRLFVKGFKALRNGTPEPDTMGGHVTFAKFMEVFRKEPRTWT